MALQFPFPYFASPTRNIRCSSSVQGWGGARLGHRHVRPAPPSPRVPAGSASVAGGVDGRAASASTASPATPPARFFRVAGAAPPDVVGSIVAASAHATASHRAADGDVFAAFTFVSRRLVVARASRGGLLLAPAFPVARGGASAPRRASPRRLVRRRQPQSLRALPPRSHLPRARMPRVEPQEQPGDVRARGVVAHREEHLGEVFEEEGVIRPRDEAALERVPREVEEISSRRERAEATPQARVRGVDLDRGGVRAQGFRVVRREVAFGRRQIRVFVGVVVVVVVVRAGASRVLALDREVRDEPSQVLQREELHLRHRRRQRRRVVVVVVAVGHQRVPKDPAELAHRVLPLPVANEEQRGLVRGRQQRLLRLGRAPRFLDAAVAARARERVVQGGELERHDGDAGPASSTRD
eukprot:31124-Pelagococcus_subviridis.AAC.10